MTYTEMLERLKTYRSPSDWHSWKLRCSSCEELQQHEQPSIEQTEPSSLLPPQKLFFRTIPRIMNCTVLTALDSEDFHEAR